MAAWVLTRGETDPALYVRGGPGDPDFWPGLSDLDLVLVVCEQPGSPGRAAARVSERWRRLQSRLVFGGLLDWPRVYEPRALSAFASASAFTFGLGRAGSEPPGRAAYFGSLASLDGIRMLERPGLYGATAGWRRLSGPDRLPPESGRDAQEVRIAAWLELLYWWRWAFRLCAFPMQPRAADLSVKLIAESARIWLWLAHRERACSREDALERALRRLPEDEAALRFALDLRRRLPDSPEEPLRAAMPAALRMSARIARELEAQVAECEWTEVRLIGATPGTAPEASGGPALPLVDWRSIACAPTLDEALVRAAGEPGDPHAVALAARSHPDGAYPALPADGVLVMPAVDLVRSRLRALKCPIVDPVVFAVLEGAGVARFPGVRGWSAQDTARRAVAEHRARLMASPTTADDRADAARLAGERARLFLESVESGEPELCVTADAVAERV